MERDDEFYIGWAEQAPPGLSRFARRTTIGLLLGAALTALLAILAQDPADPGSFPFARRETFRGVLRERPYPLLIDASRQPAVSRLLVGTGKRGAAPAVRGLDGEAIVFDGTPIERSQNAMVEVRSEVRIDATAGTASVEKPARDLGMLTLVGEIVDAKCFLGVMKPGRGKPHRSCAARCISGGAPPMLWVRSGGGNLLLLLVDADGGPLTRGLTGLVGEPVEVTGAVRQIGDMLYLAAAPETYRRMS
jgi:hypothetical protein